MFMGIFTTYRKSKKNYLVEDLFLEGGGEGLTLCIINAESELEAFWLGFYKLWKYIPTALLQLFMTSFKIYFFMIWKKSNNDFFLS